MMRGHCDQNMSKQQQILHRVERTVNSCKSSMTSSVLTIQMIMNEDCHRFYLNGRFQSFFPANRPQQKPIHNDYTWANEFILTAQSPCWLGGHLDLRLSMR